MKNHNEYRAASLTADLCWVGRILLLLLAGLLVLLLMLIGYSKLAFWEPSGFTQDTFAHWWKVPAHVDEAVLWDVCLDPVYHYKIRDGEHPEIIGVRYGISTAEIGIKEQLDKFAKQHGCVFNDRKENVTSLSCTSKDLFWIQVWAVETTDACSEISIVIFTGN